MVTSQTVFKMNYYFTNIIELFPTTGVFERIILESHDYSSELKHHYSITGFKNGENVQKQMDNNINTLRLFTLLLNTLTLFILFTSEY